MEHNLRIIYFQFSKVNKHAQVGPQKQMLIYIHIFILAVSRLFPTAHCSFRVNTRSSEADSVQIVFSTSKACVIFFYANLIHITEPVCGFEALNSAFCRDEMRRNVIKVWHK